MIKPVTIAHNQIVKPVIAGSRPVFLRKTWNASDSGLGAVASLPVLAIGLVSAVIKAIKK